MIALTPRQQKALRFIGDHIRETGIGPSYDDIATEMGHSSRGTSHRLVHLLCERGYLRRLPHKARALEVVAQTMPSKSYQLRPEIERAAGVFAAAHNIETETAVNEACRIYFMGAE